MKWFRKKTKSDPTQRLSDNRREMVGFACNKLLAAGIRNLAYHCGVPYYVMFEHCLEIGYCEVSFIAAKPEMVPLLRDHLIQVHPLGKNRQKPKTKTPPTSGPGLQDRHRKIVGFNCNMRLATHIRELARQCHVRRYNIVFEHVLEMGYHEVSNIVCTPELKEELVAHLIQSHLLVAEHQLENEYDRHHGSIAKLQDPFRGGFDMKVLAPEFAKSEGLTLQEYIEKYFPREQIKQDFLNALNRLLEDYGGTEGNSKPSAAE